MFYTKLFYTANLKLINYLTIEKKFPIIKLKRDGNSDFKIFVYFEDTEALQQAVAEYKAVLEDDIKQQYINRMERLQNGLWTEGDVNGQ